ncbi:uncharacterized protein LOC103722949 [Phoenix dactylifera]|uniref:U5 small nuclear ribonucleoprotein TSSC4 n=1 Tax=Phoenix dactylifera TaxID=42345 RepID=A0A8B7D2M4_PHODC|nr:uncharacterized protein LOC103722949 [Phoenix dactylifera]
MDESFEVRVKRLFGSRLFDSVPGSSFPASSWSVSDGEVARSEWNRERGAGHDRDETPCSSAFAEGGCFAKKLKNARYPKKDQFEDDLDELDDGDDDGGGGGGEDGGDDVDREEREIRSSIGMDPTLDNEDEEDEYDRAAIGMENAGDRLYMRDVTDHGPRINFHTLGPDFPEDSYEEMHDFRRDPRADHFAASARLKEDKKAAVNCHPLRSHDCREPAVDLQVKIAKDDTNLKPILKRKEEQDDSKPKKRVRFDPGCKDVHAEVNEECDGLHMFPESMKTTAATEESLGIPDYIRNPSKYIHYTFDSSEEIDDKTNRQAFAEFCNLVKRSNPDQMQPEFPGDLPKSVTFTPRKKSGDAMSVDDSSQNTRDSSRELGQVSACSTGIAARDQESDACDMEEDGMEASTAVASISSRKAGRMYRTKSTSDDST